MSSAQLVTILNQINSVHALNTISLRSVLILWSYERPFCLVFSFLQILDPKLLFIYVLPHACQVARQSHPFSFHHPNDTKSINEVSRYVIFYTLRYLICTSKLQYSVKLVNNICICLNFPFGLYLLAIQSIVASTVIIREFICEHNWLS